MGKRGGKISPATEFKKGQSGNPNGRPPKLPQLDKLMADVLGKEDGSGKTEAQKILEKIIEKAKSGDVRAAEVLLDRGYGKPKQTQDLNVFGSEIVINRTVVKKPDGDKPSV